MKPTLPPKLPPARAIRPKSGELAYSSVTTHKAKDGAETVLASDEESQEWPAKVDQNAQAGVSLGYTIPGPPGSYASVRIDVFVSLPTTPDRVPQTLDVATAMAEKKAEQLNASAVEFFRRWK